MLKYKLKKIPRKKTIVWATILLLFVISISSIVRYYASYSDAINSLGAPGSGRNATTLYVNDLESDWNYYIGLNYTEILSKTDLPSYHDNYGESNLVAVKIVYDGTDINHYNKNDAANFRGKVSNNANEGQYILEYYKYYPAKGSGSSRYVDIELIDNPYTVRPNGLGFNGWVCNGSAYANGPGLCSNSTISYDDTYYTRYIRVVVGTSSTATLYLNASWATADVRNTYAENFSSKTMKHVDVTNHNIYLNYDKYLKIRDDYGFRDTVTYLNTTRHEAGNNATMTNQSGGTQVFYQYRTSNNGSYTTTYTLANSGTTCTYNRCRYYDTIPIPQSGVTQTPTNYAVANGTTYTAITNNNATTYFDLIPVYDWVAQDPEMIGVQTDPIGKADMSGYYYQTTAGGDGYYSATGTTSGSRIYKLIQFDDTTLRDTTTSDYVNYNYASVYNTYSSGDPQVNQTRFRSCNKDSATGTSIDCKVNSSNYATRMSSYYYLVTRDINIFTANTGAVAKPMTVENATYNGTSASADLAIVGTGNGSTAALSYNITVGYHNFKIGRNVSSGSESRQITGSSGTTSGKMKVIVESGTYRDLISKGSDNQTSTAAIFVYGSDYDRVMLDNDNLIVRASISASKSSGNATSTTTVPSSAITVKSGTIGTGAGTSGTSGNLESYYTIGIYVGSWNQSSNNTALRTLVVEGGVILNINGGPCVDSNINGNAIGIYVKGGVVTSIFGGAGQTATYGNRIISVTGGQVTNSVAGGSNGNVNSGGAMRGDTLVYIGGNAKIGYKASDGQIPTYGEWGNNATNWARSTFYGLYDQNYGDYKGSVFGAGLGQLNSNNDGVVNNSHVIINGGTVYGSVFGGGNFGTTGLLETNKDSSATIDILGGVVEGSVYGAGNRVGGGNSSTGSGSSNNVLSRAYYVRNNHSVYSRETETQTETYTCTATGNNRYCTRYSNTYWGTATTSTSSTIEYATIPAGYYDSNGAIIPADTTCTTANGTQGNYNNYGGWSAYSYSPGPYYGTYTDRYVNGATRTRNRSHSRNITCNYYSFSQVNAGSPYNSGTTYYDLIDGQYVPVTPEYSGNASNTYRHNITININGGTVNNSVFGGSNINGTVYGNVTINMLKGTVNGTTSGVYGGGYGSSTKVLGNTIVSSSTTDDSLLHVNEVYGGSSQGEVNEYGYTTVTINGGTFGTVYGGGKGENGNTPSSYGNVTVNIQDGSIGDAFNGNNVLGGPNGTMNINVSGGEIGNVYGGSNGAGASASSTHVLVTGGTIGNVFGGGKKAVTNGTANVDIQGGTFTDTQGGTYGGGNEARVVSSVITVTGGTYSGTCGAGASVFGGGNKVVDENNAPITAVTTSSTVNINSGANVANVYGGSNQAGLVNVSYVNANSGTVNCNVYGGGYKAKTTTTNVSLTGSTFSAVETGTSSIIADKPYGNAFGGGQSANVENSHITLDGATVNNVYGGSNQLGLVNSSEVIITSGKATNVFGGNNAGGATEETKVTLDGSANITDVFGGSNGMGAIIGFYEEAITGPYEYENTDLEQMTEGSTLVEIKSGTIEGNVYGGGNKAIVVGESTINMTAGTVKGNVFGGGNEAHIGTPLTRFSVITPLQGPPNTNTGKFDESSPNSNNKVTVNIVNGTVKGNVFGSGNVAFIHGDTYVNIGAKALDELGLNSNSSYAITIEGNVFGGSYSISKEDDSYLYDSIGVGGSTNVNIDSTGYYTNNETRVHVTKSVYGEGNNSSVTKKANINILNHGTIEHPATMLLIARATDVKITDSVLELNGDRDKAQYIDKKKYSFVTINNLYLLGSSGSNSTGTTLYLFGGGKELKNMYSGYFDGNTFEKETLTGNNPGGADNRIYMAPSKVLYVSTGEAYSSTPGYVNGIAFLGMYHHSGTTIQTGIYDPDIYDYVDQNGIVNDTKYNEFNPKSDFTYVYGSSFLRGENGAQTSSRINIRVDGFYTNYADATTHELTTDFVGVTPEEENYYEWVIGNRSLEIEVYLEASKYSMKSYQDVSIRLDNLTGWKNAVITLDSVSTSEFGGTNISNIASTVTPFQTELISKTGIQVINEGTDPISGVTDANRQFGLTMGTTTDGWLSNYSTDFTGSAGVGDTIIGDKEYYYDSTTGIRDLSFWLHSSKNIDMSIIDPLHPDDDIYLGVVKVVGTARQKNPLDEGGEIKYDITISVHISLTDGDFDGYGYNIAPGKKYNSFASRPTTIGSDGAFSIYQSLSMDLTKQVGTNDTRIWKNLLYGQNSNYHRYLKSGVQFPAGTRITMIDLITNEQYFYTTTGQETSDASNNYIYPLSGFVSMSNVSGSQKYFADELGNILTNDPDIDNDLKYYNRFASSGGTSELQTEEFIFTVDFSSVANMPSSINSYLYMEIEDKTNAGNPSVSLATGNPRDAMAYSVVSSGSNTIETDGGFLNNPSDINSAVSPTTNFNIYRQTPATLYLNTRLNTSGNVDNYTDTKYDDYKLGVNIRFKKVEEDENHNITTTDVGYNVLEGLVVTIGDESYSPETDGTIKLALAGRISNVASNLRFDFSRVSESEFEFGKYQVCVDPFGSYDGLYAENDHDSGQEQCFNFELLNDNFGIVVTTEPVMITHDILTGEDAEGSRVATYKVKEINGLANPKLRVSITRLNDHTGNDYSSIEYTPKDLCDFVVSMKIQGSTVNCSSASRYVVDGNVYYDLGPIAKNTETTYNIEVTYKEPTTSDISSPGTSLWRSGTYKINFSIFDGDGNTATLMGGDYEYLIIRKLDIEELVADSGSGG